MYIVVGGGLICGLIGSIWGLAFLGAIAGLMLGFAGRTAWVLFSQPMPLDEYSSGKSRTEEDVRQALAELQAREK